MNLEKVGTEMSYIQSQMHPDYDSAESIAESDLEDGELREMLASPLYMQSREDCESSRIPIAPGKPAAVFSLGSGGQGNQFKSSVFKHTDPSNLRRSLLEGNKDHLLSQARPEQGKSSLDFPHLMGISRRGDNVQGFDTKSDEVLLYQRKFLKKIYWRISKI